MTMYSLMESPPGPETIIDGVSYLYFGGTSYLGLAANPEVIEAGCAAMRRYGVHSATTRARFGTTPVVLDVERRAAEYFGTEDAFYFGSGYVSNHILVNALGPQVETVLVDESSHYCVMEASRLAGVPVICFKHADPQDLGRRLEGRQRVLVMADAVGPSTGEIAPVAEYIKVLEHCAEGHLLLDDAHGFGVLGDKGRGVFDELGLWDRVNGRSAGVGPMLHVCGTLSKALGGFGGIIPGTREYLRRARKASHYFDGASAPATAEAGAAAKALEIVSRDGSLREKVRARACQLKTALRGMGLSVPDGRTAVFGVSIGSAENMQRIHETLKARRILVPYMGAYSGTPPQGILRFAVFANHSEEQIGQLISEIRAAL